MKSKFIFLFSSLFFCTMAQAQTLAKLDVTIEKPLNGLAVPASVNLDEITFLPDSALTLVKVQGNKRTAVPFQIKQGEKRRVFSGR